MKKIITLIVLFSITAQAQIINIPDANFKAKLVAANTSNQIASSTVNSFTSIVIDVNGNGEIEESEALLVKQLKIPNEGISSLVGIENFTNLRKLYCDNNNLTSFNGNALINLSYLDCSHNQLTSLQVEQINNTFSYLNCSFNNLTSFTVPNFYGFEDMGGQTMFLNCSNNQLTEIFFDQSNGHEDLSGLVLSNNNFSELTLSNITVYGSVSLSNNPLNNLDISDLHMGSQDYDSYVTLAINNTNLTQLTIPGTSNTKLIIKDNPNLISLDIKNGERNVFFYYVYEDEEEYLIRFGIELENNPLLSLICCDNVELAYVSSLLPNAQVTEYCNFTPGGNYNTITGTVSLGCSNGELITSNVKVIVNNVYNTSFIENSNTYISYTDYGTKNVTLSLPHPSYYTVTPANYSFYFQSNGNEETADFCLTPNGVHHDMAVTIIPTTPARPGFDATYAITYKNLGNQTQSGTVNLLFQDTVLDFVSAIPNVTTNAPDSLEWAFVDMAPFETRTITVTFNVNSPMETPATNIGDVLSFTAYVAGEQADETPADNNMIFNQTIVGSYDPNDKTVVEGDQISFSTLGDEYLHYVVRFQNTGTAAAQNVVVIDYLTFRMEFNTLEIISCSHSYRTKLNGWNLEFIFENINLPAAIDDEPGSHGYIAFKIKPKNTVVLNDVIENTANIYFDYNYPIVTNTVSTTVTALKNNSFENASFSLYPNPTKNLLNITISDATAIKTISVYNLVGQKILSFKASNSIDVSALPQGSYLLTLETTNGKATQRFIKI